MAIKIPSLKAIADRLEAVRYLYKDLHLDFDIATTYDPNLDPNLSFSASMDEDTLRGNPFITKNDIKVDYNELAIKNSIRNLFNTKKGQRFLFPLYGLDLSQYLFSPITRMAAEAIGDEIIRSIETFEPRVRVQTCIVEPNPDENLYTITIIIEMPDLNKSTPLYSTLDLKTQSFIFTQNSRNS